MKFNEKNGLSSSHFLDEQHRGEIKVCRIRFIGLFIFYLNHSVNFFLTHRVSLRFHLEISALVMVWFLLAIAIWTITSVRSWYSPLLGYFSTALDVIFLTLALAIGGKDLSQVFVVYYPLIVLGGLRYSFGFTLFAGLLSSACYAAVSVRNDVLASGHVDTLELVIRVLAMLFLSLIAAYIVENGSRLVRRIIKEELHAKRVKDTLARYVSRQVADEILKTRSGFEMRGDRRDVTILLSDIRGFTTLAENMSAESVVKLLNEYFSKMIDIVFKYRGTLDKFIGDAMLVVFGAPLPEESHAQLAVQTAIEMQRVMTGFNRERKKNGRKEIHIGIGIHTGAVVAGNIGSEKRLEYTVIGDTVNLAQRIESRSAGGDILISHETYKNLKTPISVEELPATTVKGRKQAVLLYRVKTGA